MRILHQRAALIMGFERLWPLALPSLLLLALFASLSWLGVFQALPRALHLTALIVFGIGFLTSLSLLFFYKKPSPAEVTSRLELENRLHHNQLSLADDQIISTDQDPVALALWHEHQRRMNAQLQQLHSFLPHPTIPQYDPWALRGFIILLFVVTASFSFSKNSGSLTDIFYPPATLTDIAIRADAWIAPPAYTGHAPLFLKLNDNNEASEKSEIKVPQNSIIHVQFSSDAPHSRLVITTQDGVEQQFSPQPLTPENANTTSTDQITANATGFTVPLTQTAHIALKLGSQQHEWDIAIKPDAAPIIEFTRDPTQALNGTLDLHYKAEDDYGISALNAVFELTEPDQNTSNSLVLAPEIKLPVPRKKTKETTSTQDLTSHPWAGKLVSLKLFANDEADQTSKTAVKQFVLPQRPFQNDLAKALIEQRQILALDKRQKQFVIQMLDALMMHPSTTINNFSHFLGLNSIRQRLTLARNDDELRDVVDYMWSVARGIEDGLLSDAEKNLRQAQDALQQALQNNASAEEIDRLMQQLRDAMQKYLTELAQRQQQGPQATQKSDPNSRTLSQQDIDRLMQQIEDLARSGHHDQAQALLSQLQNMMNNLQTGSQSAQGRGQQGQSQQNSAQQQMNQLGDLMRRQQELMNETFKQDQKLSEYFDDIPDEHNQALNQLQQEQQALQNELKELLEKLQQQGMELSDSLDQAENLMGRAGKALQKGESGIATDRQGEAIEALRNGAREMMQQMQQAQGQGSGNQQNQQRRDPLGRETGASGSSEGDNSTKIPDQIDIQKARQTLDEIRKKLGNALSPEQEKNYLERLLKLD